MYKIKLCDKYGRNSKLIGAFAVKKDWRECTKEVYQAALPFEGTVYDLDPATITEEPKPVELPEVTVEATEPVSIEVPETESDDDTEILIPEPSEEIKEPEPTEVEGVNLTVKEEPETPEPEVTKEVVEEKPKAKKPKGGGSKGKRKKGNRK